MTATTVCYYCDQSGHEPDDCPAVRAERRRHDAAKKAEALVEQLGHFVNGMQHEEFEAFATALANEHPTLLGQIAKAVGVGVMRRALYEPEWKPFARAAGAVPCYLPSSGQHYVTLGRDGTEVQLPQHTAHDGRLDCTTVIGAELMARQSYI